ncbi:zonular occludens toxin domain-containing protein [Paenibacillus sp. NPDC058367]|uniref:zonular occludens toxin domain-containing protein n=1 Tax=Paenibacillus sp. NPDC058367 TaxID=3346460 RepID=UPI00364D8BB9
MITLYTGSVGSGKSFHGVEIGWEWIKKRRKMAIANFPLIFKPKEAKLSERWIFQDEITVEWLMAMSIEHGWYGKESQCVVIIDEAGIIFNSRDWQTKGGERMKWIKFLSQSRKFGYDFIFICQADRMIDKQIRGLVEYEVKHLKANNSFFMSFLSIFKFTLFLYVYRWYQTRMKSNLRFSYYKPWLAKRYDTFRTFNLDELVEYLEKLYEGKVIPSMVATFIDAQRAELEERLAEKIKAQQDAEECAEDQGPREGPSREGTGGLRSRKFPRLFGRRRKLDNPIYPAVQNDVKEETQNEEEIAQ